MEDNIVYGKGMWQQQKEDNIRRYYGVNNSEAIHRSKQIPKSKKIKVVCDDCGQEFIINGLEEKYIGSMLTTKYFVCPKCGRKYVIGVFDNKRRRLEREYKDLMQKGFKGLAELKMAEIIHHSKKLIKEGNRYE